MTNFLKAAKRLPVLDWNLTFFGAHEQTVSNNWNVPIEKHSAFECIYVIAGTEYVSIHQQNYELNKGDFIMIPPEFHHTVAAKTKLTYFCFHFDIDDPHLKIQLIQNLSYYNSSTSVLCQKLTPHLNELDSLVNQAPFNFDTKMIIQVELSKILQILYDMTQDESLAQSSTNTEYARIMADFMTNSLTNHTLEFIKNGITTTDTKGLVAQAIREVGISNGYGFRVFKQIYGVSPREYLSKIKINEAKKLLMKPQYTVTDISDALGYKNLTNFSRQFKRWTGLSPKQWKVQTFKAN